MVLLDSFTKASGINTKAMPKFEVIIAIRLYMSAFHHFIRELLMFLWWRREFIVYSRPHVIKSKFSCNAVIFP